MPIKNFTDADFIPDVAQSPVSRAIPNFTDADFIPDKTLVEKQQDTQTGETIKMFDDGSTERVPLKEETSAFQVKDYDVPDTYESKRSLLGAAGEGFSNLPSNIGEAAKGLWDMVTSPVQTAKSIGNIGIGLINKVIPEGQKYDLEIEGMSKEDADKTLSAMWHGAIDKYSDYDKFKDALAEKPLDILMDAVSFVPAGQVAKVITKIKGSKLGKAIVATPGEALKATVKKIHPMGNQIDGLAFFDALDEGIPLSKKGLSSKKKDTLREDLDRVFAGHDKELARIRKEAKQRNLNPEEIQEKIKKAEELMREKGNFIGEYRNLIDKTVKDKDILNKVITDIKEKYPTIKRQDDIVDAVAIINKKLKISKEKVPNLDIRNDLLKIKIGKKDKILGEMVSAFNKKLSDSIRKKMDRLKKEVYGVNYEKALNVHNNLKKHFNEIPEKTLLDGLKDLGLPSVVGLGGLAINPTLGALSSLVTSPLGRSTIARGLYGGTVKVPRYIAKTKAGKAGLWIGDKAISKKGVVVYNMLKKIQDAQVKLEDLKQPSKKKRGDK